MTSREAALGTLYPICSRSESFAGLAAPEDGWSTITFLGIVPSHRRRGLGLQVHRHGIATLRALGGATYHDGTSEANEAMQRLFAKQGCLEFARMGEWRAAPHPEDSLRRLRTTAPASVSPLHGRNA